MPAITDRIQRPFSKNLKAVFSLLRGDQELDFLRQVVPTWDVNQLMLGRADFQWVEGSAVVGAGVTGVVTFTVGADEEWDVLMIGANKPLTTVAAVAPKPMLRPNGSGVAANTGFQPGDQSYYAEASSIGGGIVYNPPFVLCAGDVLNYQWGNPDGVNRTFFAAMLRRIRSLR